MSSVILQGFRRHAVDASDRFDGDAVGHVCCDPVVRRFGGLICGQLDFDWATPTDRAHGLESTAYDPAPTPMSSRRQSRRNWKASNSVLLPVPFAPTKIANDGRSRQLEIGETTVVLDPQRAADASTALLRSAYAVSQRLATW